METPSNPDLPHASRYSAFLDGLPAVWQCRPYRTPRSAPLRLARSIERTGPLTVRLTTAYRGGRIDCFTLDFTKPGTIGPDAWLDASRAFLPEPVPGCDRLPSMPWPPVPA